MFLTTPSAPSIRMPSAISLLRSRPPLLWRRGISAFRSLRWLLGNMPLSPRFN